MALTLSGVAKLRNAALVLRETTGFAYLPIIVPYEVAGSDALNQLRHATAIDKSQWHEVPWPKRDDSSVTAWEPPTSEQLATQRKALLQAIDELIHHDAAPNHTLVLDASPSTRHALATEVITYINQRREPLRTHRLRLILIWPATLVEELRGGAPDLWSQRALAVVLDETDVQLPQLLDTNPPSETSINPKYGTAATKSNPVIEAQLRNWYATHDLAAANLSNADALTLARLLCSRFEYVEAYQIALASVNSRPEDKAELASGYAWMGEALSALGRKREAMVAVQAAVEILGPLTQASPGYYEADLAAQLNNLANLQSANGDHASALTTAHHAVAIMRVLAVVAPDIYEPDLAMTLNNLGNRQGQAGDRASALATAREAVEIRRRLTKDNQAAHETDLAMSLLNLANRQSGNGDNAGALTAIREAVNIYRSVSKANPSAFEPALATSLCNLSIYQSEAGENDEALITAQEAVKINRRLSQTEANIYTPQLASSLCALARALAINGKKADARATASEAVSLLEPLGQKLPGAYGSQLTTARTLLENVSEDA
jgi:hypothetical protein